MKKKTIVLSLVTVLLLGIGTTTYAATSNSETVKNICSSLGINKMQHSRGHDILTNLLKEKGATDEEIKSTLDAGKSLYDLAKEKGLTDEQIKQYMIDSKIKIIDEAVSNGSMTAEDGEQAKTRIKENIANCINPGQGHGEGKNHEKNKGHGENSQKNHDKNSGNKGHGNMNHSE